MKQQHRYVEESADLKASREMEAATSWQTLREANSDELDLSKDWILSRTGRRCGVPESYSHLYDAKVTA